MRCDSRHSRFATNQESRLALPQLALAVFALAFACDACADGLLDAIGGSGGGQFSARCANGESMIGLGLRKGDDVDAIRPLCAIPGGDRDPDVAVRGDWHGGSGGRTVNIPCATQNPSVNGLLVSFEGSDRRIVNDLALTCGPGTGRQAMSGAMSDADALQHGLQYCPIGQVAVGVHGRSGTMLDAVGLICDVPPAASKMSSPDGREIGRANRGTTPTPHPEGWTLCDAARDARSRNSPAAPNLEVQCNAFTRKTSGGMTSSTSVTPALAATTVTDIPKGTPDSGSGTKPPSKSESREAKFRALAETIRSIRDQPHSGNRDDSESAPNTIPTERVTGNRQDRYPSNSQSRNVETTQARPVLSSQDFSQPENSIRIKVRYPMTYGYKEATDGHYDDPSSCMAFYISVLPASGLRRLKPVRVDTLPHMRSSNGVYTCEYQTQDLPRDQPLFVRVMMSDQRVAGSEVWLEGSQAQPPAGQRRTVLDGERQVVLSAANPRVALIFQMAYAGGSP